MSELGPRLHDLIEGSLTPVDVDAIVAHRRRRRRQRRGALAIAATVVVITGAISTWALLPDTHKPVAGVNVVPRDDPAATQAALARSLIMSAGGGSGALGEPLTSLTVVDPSSGATHEIPLPLPGAQSSVYPYLVRGSSFVVVLDSHTGADAPAIGTAYAVPSSLKTAVTIGKASYVVPALEPDRAWLVTDDATPRQRLNGISYGKHRAIGEVDLRARRVSPTYMLTDDRSPVAEVDGGLLTTRPGATTSAPRVIEVWDPATNHVVRRLANGDVTAASGAFVLWTPANCEPVCVLHLADVRTGSDRTFSPPAGMQWDASPSSAEVAFSPDGRSLAVVARPEPAPGSDKFGVIPESGTSPAVIATFDVSKGAQHQRRLDLWTGSVTLGWSPDSTLLLFTTDNDHVGYLPIAAPASALQTVKIAAAGEYFVVGRQPATPPTTTQRYTIDARVEQDATHGPELCILITTGTTRDSSDCAGPQITNWNWSTAPDPRHSGGRTFGTYRVVGTYDGTLFTVTETPVKVAAPRNETHEFPAPCATPPGGWHATSATHLGLADFQALQALTQGAPDFAGLWMSTTSSSAPVNDFQHSQVTVVAFTGDLARHRRELAAVWGGPVCVMRHPHSYSELQAVVQHILAALDHKELALQDIMIGPDDVTNVVDLQVVAATDATQREIDRRFGPGLVKVSSLMTPVH